VIKIFKESGLSSKSKLGQKRYMWS